MSTGDEKKLSDEEIRAYWTPERMAAAEPKVWTPATTPKPDAEPVPPTGEPRVIPGYDPTKNTETSEVGSPQVVVKAGPVPNPAAYPWRTVGKLYLVHNGKNYHASACIIDYNTLLTAAHNIYDKNLYSSAYLFIPALLADGTHPYGDWTIEDDPKRAIVMPQWKTSKGDEAYDVGVLRYPEGRGTDRPIGSAVGALPWMYNQPIGAETDWVEVAYPGSGHPGYDPLTMYVDPGTYLYTSDSGGVVYKTGTLPKGSSGGPWLWYDTTTGGVGPINGVRSFQLTEDPREKGSPYFRDSIADFIDSYRV